MNKTRRISSARLRLRTLMLISVGATALLIFTAVIVAAGKERKNSAVTLAEPITVTLYTPEKSVPIGVQLSSVKFRELIWPRNQIPEDAVMNLKDVLNFYTTEVLEPGPPLRYRQISREPIVVSLPLNPGMRAVSIEVDETTSVEGFARPGTRVDITLTYRNEKTKSLETRIIVHNARVLSLGGDPTVFTGGNQDVRRVAPRRTTLTLEVSPEEALIIQTARQSGRLGLIMRSPDDTSIPKVDSVSDQVIRDPSFRAQKVDEPKCKSGTVKIGDKMFAISCDRAGELIPLD